MSILIKVKLSQSLVWELDSNPLERRNGAEEKKKNTIKTRRAAAEVCLSNADRSRRLNDRGEAAFYSIIIIVRERRLNIFVLCTSKRKCSQVCAINTSRARICIRKYVCARTLSTSNLRTLGHAFLWLVEKNAVFFFPPTRRCRCRNLLHVRKKKSIRTAPAKKSRVTDQPIHFPISAFFHATFIIEEWGVRETYWRADERVINDVSIFSLIFVARRPRVKWTKLILNVRCTLAKWYLSVYTPIKSERYKQLRNMNTLRVIANN